MKIGPYTISRGAVIPYEEDSRIRNINIHTDGDGGVVVTGDSYIEKYIHVTIKVSREEALTLKGYIENNCRMSSTVITFIDDFGTSWPVRFWGNTISMLTLASNVVEMKLLFRVEVSKT